LDGRRERWRVRSDLEELAVSSEDKFTLLQREVATFAEQVADFRLLPCCETQPDEMEKNR
jgi:hypothetical protein